MKLPNDHRFILKMLFGFELLPILAVLTMVVVGSLSTLAGGFATWCFMAESQSRERKGERPEGERPEDLKEQL